MGDWHPSEEEWMMCLQRLQTEERERINRSLRTSLLCSPTLSFYRPQKGGEKLVGRHNPDAKSSLMGISSLLKGILICFQAAFSFTLSAINAFVPSIRYFFLARKKENLISYSHPVRLFLSSSSNRSLLTLPSPSTTSQCLTLATTLLPQINKDFYLEYFPLVSRMIRGIDE